MELVFTTSNISPVTLNVSANVGDFEYLHLLDLSTGDDIDLLRQSSYTFDALGQNREMCYKILYKRSGVEMGQ
jgi:hypothetical protein